MLSGYTPILSPKTKRDQLNEIISSLEEILEESERYSSSFCNEINEVLINLKEAREKLEALARVVYARES